MPINYVVRADVVDIAHDKPTSADAFLVDSNVWLWATYTKASSGAPTHQATDYPNFLQRCLVAHSRLYWCGLFLAELAHNIEKTEREIFNLVNPAVMPKEFRHNYPVNRSAVVSEVQAAWAQVSALGEPLTVSIDENVTDQALARLVAQPLDGYDVLAVEGATKAGLVDVLTDDGDYSAVPGLRVFTANPNVIASARQCGRLVGR